MLQLFSNLPKAVRENPVEAHSCQVTSAINRTMEAMLLLEFSIMNQTKVRTLGAQEEYGRACEVSENLMRISEDMHRISELAGISATVISIELDARDEVGGQKGEAVSLPRIPSLH